MPVGLRPRHRAAGRDRLVVGMGVEGDERVRPCRDPCHRRCRATGGAERLGCACGYCRLRNLTLASGNCRHGGSSALSSGGNIDAQFEARRRRSAVRSSGAASRVGVRQLRRRRRSVGRRRRETPATTSSDADLDEERARRRAGRDRHRDPASASITVEDEPHRTARTRALADGMKAYFDMVNDDGGIYGRELKLVDRARRPASAAEPGAGPGEPRRGQRVRDVHRDAALHRRRAARRGRASRRSSGTSTPSAPATTTSSRNTGALCFGCAGQIVPYLAKELGATKVGILAYGVANAVEAVRDGHPGVVREVPDRRGRVLRRHASASRQPTSARRSRR